MACRQCPGDDLSPWRLPKILSERPHGMASHMPAFSQRGHAPASQSPPAATAVAVAALTCPLCHVRVSAPAAVAVALALPSEVTRWWLTTWTPSPKWRQASAPWCRAQLPQVSNKRHGEGGKRGLSEARPKETHGKSPHSRGSVSHLEAVLLPMRWFSTPEVQFFGPDGRDRIRQSIDADRQQSQALAQLEDNLRAQNDWESADSIAQRLVQFWDLF